MNERISKLADHALGLTNVKMGELEWYDDNEWDAAYNQIFAELIVQECLAQIDLSKTSQFISLEDANRMKHFVAVTQKKVSKHFGVE